MNGEKFLHNLTFPTVDGDYEGKKKLEGAVVRHIYYITIDQDGVDDDNYSRFKMVYIKCDVM